jgi:hypothetical protein
MKPNRILVYSISLAFLILVMACTVFGGKEEGSSPSTPKDSAYLGEEYRSEEGGFSIQKIKDYEFNDVIGIVNMLAPGGDKNIGPGIMVLGGLMDEDMTNDNLLEKMRADSTDLKILKEKSIKVAGKNGYTADIEGSFDGKPVKGRVVIAMVTPRQQFNMMGFAPKEKWNELSPIYEAVLGSVKFFEPNTVATTAPGEQEATIKPEEQAAESGTPGHVIPTAKPGEIRQWAVSAKASSQYGNPDWAASQALGKPDVIECGDNTNAWASYNNDTIEWIELTYETPVNPTEINIYQNYNPSQVVEVRMTATDGSKYIAWEGYPETVENCPDQMTITLDLTKKIKVNKVRITVDQRVSGWGWDEIDAVELVGSTDGAISSSLSKEEPTVSSSSSKPEIGKPAPTNYSGWMAGKNYQGYASIAINKTKEKDLDGLIGLKGKKSTENFKPRADHKDTYIYDFGDGMKAYISVLTNGSVYKKSITPDAYPKDFKLDTVTKENYNKLDAIYNKEKAIAYAVMANMLKSPGFVREAYFADGKMKVQYEWYAANGDRISGFFLDDFLTGMAGLAYIPKE